MKLDISDNRCWCCGENKQLTRHHAIPKCLEPKKNALVPICQECHTKIHNRSAVDSVKYIQGIFVEIRKMMRRLSKRQEGIYEFFIEKEDEQPKETNNI